jgi:very-short-patch-repair endonuclease
LNPSQPIDLARELRSRQTDAEMKLWTNLRAKRFEGYKFRRQQPIGNYIVDFICFNQKLVIEVDGSQHNESPGLEKDKQRTKYLESQGYQVVRFGDNDVFQNIEGVIFKISEVIQNNTRKD